MDLMKQFTVRKQSAPSAIANAAVVEVDTPIVNPMLRKLSKMSFMNRGENASRTGGNTKDYDSIDMIDLRNENVSIGEKPTTANAPKNKKKATANKPSGKKKGKRKDEK